MIFVNFKTYEEGTGEKALELARICQEVEQETEVKIFPVVQTADIYRLASQNLTVWAQHIDDIPFGPNTGLTLPQAIAAAGAKGTLLNHSENKLPVETIGSIIERTKGLGFLVCAEALDEAQRITEFKPDLIAYEPPELIGRASPKAMPAARGDVAVSSAKPEIIADFTKKIKDIPVLVGAGIHDQQDVRKSLSLGAVGILVSSAVVLADNQKEVLLDLAKGFKHV